MSLITRCCLGFILSAVSLVAAVDQKAEGPLVKGMVTRVLEDRKVVMVKHEEIPGVMRAMTMGFAVSEETLPKLKAGAYLTGILEGGRGDWRLTHVVLTDRHYKPLPEEASAEGGEAGASGEAQPDAQADGAGARSTAGRARE